MILVNIKKMSMIIINNSYNHFLGRLRLTMKITASHAITTIIACYKIS